MPSKDNIADLLEMIESQGFSYILTIVEPKKEKKNGDDITIFTSLEEESFDKLWNTVKKRKK